MSGRVLGALLGAMLTIGACLSGTSQAANEPTTSTNTAAAFYDAGNAEARSGHPAMAVLDYERARLLAPEDPDISANLRHVRESAGLPPQTGGWLQAHDRFASPNTMYWLGLLGLACAGASLVTLRALRRRAQSRPTSRASVAALRIIACVGGLLTLLSVGDAMATNSVLHKYVVLQTSPATGSPVSNGAPLFTVNQADVVRVDDRHQGFLLVTDPLGRQGWVARARLQPIIPVNRSGL